MLAKQIGLTASEDRETQQSFLSFTILMFKEGKEIKGNDLQKTCLAGQVKIDPSNKDDTW